jgi:hypothetical protein
MDAQLPGAPSLEQVAAFFRKDRTGLVTLVFMDIVGSIGLKPGGGDAEALKLFQRHRAIFRETSEAVAERDRLAKLLEQEHRT